MKPVDLERVDMKFWLTVMAAKTCFKFCLQCDRTQHVYGQNLSDIKIFCIHVA